MNDLLNHPLISQRYFFPRRGCLSVPFMVAVDGAQLACSYHEIDPQAKTLVHFHGNGEIVDDWLDGFVEAIGQTGCNCFSPSIVVTGRRAVKRNWERCWQT